MGFSVMSEINLETLETKVGDFRESQFGTNLRKDFVFVTQPLDSAEIRKTFANSHFSTTTEIEIFQ